MSSVSPSSNPAPSSGLRHETSITQGSNVAGERKVDVDFAFGIKQYFQAVHPSSLQRRKTSWSYEEVFASDRLVRPEQKIEAVSDQADEV